jgi:CYTH domain-containing protein
MTPACVGGPGFSRSQIPKYNKFAKMDKTNKTEFRRTFLIEALPEPLTRASRHLQFFDNYIENTRMRLRSIRDPETKEWTHILQQRQPHLAGDLSCLKIAEIYLNEAEHERFTLFEGKEIRKNRYFHEFDQRMFAFDVYLGELWGLNAATVEFDNAEAQSSFEPPPFAVVEVTNDPFFLGENIVYKKFADVQARVAGSAAYIPQADKIEAE